MTIQCTSCLGSFDVPDGALAGRSTVTCPLCGRIVVVRDARAPAPPADPGTEAFVEPLAPAEEPTAVGAARALLALPKDRRVSVAVLSGERKGDVFVLESPTLILGRQGGGAAVELPDPEMSRSHAAVDCHGARVVLRDLGSRNGTFVGEQRIQTRELEDKAEFRLGSTRLMLLLTPLD
jgi:hypothetical protein